MCGCEGSVCSTLKCLFVHGRRCLRAHWDSSSLGWSWAPLCSTRMSTGGLTYWSMPHHVRPSARNDMVTTGGGQELGLPQRPSQFQTSGAVPRFQNNRFHQKKNHSPKKKDRISQKHNLPFSILQTCVRHARTISTRWTCTHV